MIGAVSEKFFGAIDKRLQAYLEPFGKEEVLIRFSHQDQVFQVTSLSWEKREGTSTEAELRVCRENNWLQARIKGSLLRIANHSNFSVVVSKNLWKGSHFHTPFLVATAIGEMVSQGCVDTWESSFSLSQEAENSYEYLRQSKEWKEKLDIKIQEVPNTTLRKYYITKKY